jgi:plastocyanin
MTFSVQGMSRAAFDEWLAASKRGETPTPSIAAGSTVLDLTAAQIAFDTKELTAPANENFTIHFDNADTVIHNVAIFKGNERVFTGGPVTGPDATIDYVVPALAPGTYTFICDYHANVPDMSGTLTVE